MGKGYWSLIKPFEKSSQSRIVTVTRHRDNVAFVKPEIVSSMMKTKRRRDRVNNVSAYRGKRKMRKRQRTKRRSKK